MSTTSIAFGFRLGTIAFKLSELRQGSFKARCKMACTWLERAEAHRKEGQAEQALRALDTARFWLTKAEETHQGKRTLSAFEARRSGVA